MINKKGDVATWGYSFMLGVVIILLGLYFAPVVQSFVNDAMGSSTSEFIGLDCDTTDSNFVRGTCTIVDFSSGYFIIAIILIGLAVIGSKVIT